ncbi:MAG: lysine--tRNA ligase [Candidatus Pacearchaeota archaeon]|jgi:lysyl-tRNA synthetase class 1
MEKFFWADQIAEDLIKQKGDKSKYVCASGITPSGTIHIGNFREVITTELVLRALKDNGKKVRFIYSWDDFDRFRKVPKNVSGEYEKYLGMPVSEVPSPFEKNSDYARHFEKEFEDSLSEVGIKPEFIRQSVMNKNCEYAELIKIAIEKKNEIIKVLNKYRKEPLGKNWMPLEVYCGKCKKDSTKIINAKDYEIDYECACGFKEKIDIRKKGIVKLKWRVDWPARWTYEKVDFEPGGIDHSVYGGSFMTSKEIVKRIFNFTAPSYQLYEWVRIKGGKEFSSSSGNAISLKEVLEVYEPEILRYIFVSTRPRKGFQISFDNDIMKIYSDYDLLEKKYYEDKATEQEKRIYELSQVNKVKNKKPEKESFRHLITYVQLNKLDELNSESKARAKKVANWIEKYAEEDMKFEVRKKFSADLSEKEKQAMIELKNSLMKKEYSEEELFDEFYSICEKLKIKNTEFFNAAYKTIIGKTKGPRLANLILIAGKNNIIKLLEQIR